MLTQEICVKLENLILFSGLFYRVEVDSGVSILFKTVSQQEEKALELQTGFSILKVSEVSSNQDITSILEYDKLKRYASLYLARSVVFVNDHNLLLNRSSTLPDLEDYFKTLPLELLFYLFSEAVKKRAEEMNLAKHLEDFHRLYYSKVLWTLVKRCGFNAFAVTGIPGSDNFCLSYIQLLFMNYMERREEFERQKEMFQPFQFISGLFSKDASKKVEEHFQRLELSRIKKEKRDVFVHGVTTKEELVRQLDSMMSGQEDDADKAVKRAERHSYELWKRDYLSTHKKLVDSDIPVLGKREQEITEEYLLNEYLKHRNFKFSSWMLDEIKRFENNG